MGQLRNLLRGIAHALDQSPAQVLTALDRAVQDLGTTTPATVVLARVEQSAQDAAAGVRTLRWSSAGHLPPLLVAPDGAVDLLERPADLLPGLAPEEPRHDHTAVLHPGATVLLCTDGLAERRGEGLDTGLARLAPHPDDDIALVAVRTRPIGTDPTGT